MKKILLLVLLVCLPLACEDEIYSPIPNAQVHVELDLDFEDSKLNAGLAWKTFNTSDSHDYGRYETGFGGILVINGFGVNTVNLFAYDLACPVEADRSIKVKPDDAGKATCPKCNAIYDVAYGSGKPESGTKYGLRCYRVSPSRENRYIVSN